MTAMVSVANTEDFVQSIKDGVQSPYVGLGNFEEHHNLVFFGRDRQVSDILTILERRLAGSKSPYMDAKEDRGLRELAESLADSAVKQIPDLQQIARQISDTLSKREKRRAAAQRKEGLLAICGESGCGKSSMIRAGLIPKLRAGNLAELGGRWIVLIIRPTSSPFLNLVVKLRSILHFRKGVPNETIASSLMIHGVRSLADLMPDEESDAAEGGSIDRARFLNSNVLLIVDQFEELFDAVSTLRKPASKSLQSTSREHEKADDISFSESDFVEFLLSASRDAQKTRVVVSIAMRAERLGDCARFQGLSQAVIEGIYLVPPLATPDLKQAIEGPAAMGGLQIAPNLLTALISDTARKHKDYLPLLQYALSRTWLAWSKGERSSADRTLTAAHFASACTGEVVNKSAIGVREVLTSVVSKHHRNSKDDGTEQVFRGVFVAIFKTPHWGPNPETAVRYPTSRADIAKLIGDKTVRSGSSITLTLNNIISALIDDGILRLDTHHGQERIDVVHESIFRAWTQCRDWIETEMRAVRHFERWIEPLKTNQAHEFGEGDITAIRNWLDSEETVPRTQDWAAHTARRDEESWETSKINPIKGFVDLKRCCEEAETRIREASESSRRRRNWRIALGASVGILLAATVGYLVNSHRNQAALKKEMIASQSYSISSSVTQSNPYMKEVETVARLHEALVASTHLLSVDATAIHSSEDRRASLLGFLKLSEARAIEGFQRILAVASPTTKGIECNEVKQIGKHNTKCPELTSFGIEIKPDENHIPQCWNGDEHVLQVERRGNSMIIRWPAGEQEFRRFAMDESCRVLVGEVHLKDVNQESSLVQRIIYEIAWTYADEHWVPSFREALSNATLAPAEPDRKTQDRKILPLSVELGADGVVRVAKWNMTYRFREVGMTRSNGQNSDSWKPAVPVTEAGESSLCRTRSSWEDGRKVAKRFVAVDPDKQRWCFLVVEPMASNTGGENIRGSESDPTAKLRVVDQSIEIYRFGARDMELVHEPNDLIPLAKYRLLAPPVTGLAVLGEPSNTMGLRLQVGVTESAATYWVPLDLRAWHEIACDYWKHVPDDIKKELKHATLVENKKVFPVEEFHKRTTGPYSSQHVLFLFSNPGTDAIHRDLLSGKCSLPQGTH